MVEICTGYHRSRKGVPKNDQERLHGGGPYAKSEKTEWSKEKGQEGISAHSTAGTRQRHKNKKWYGTCKEPKSSYMAGAKTQTEPTT